MPMRPDMYASSIYSNARGFAAIRERSCRIAGAVPDAAEKNSSAEGLTCPYGPGHDLG
jgi:hypothetical protein